MKIGEVVKELRKKIVPKVTQKEFALKVGITQTYLSQIENGKKLPTIETLDKISKALGIPTPILTWKALEESDISEGKRESFKLLKGSVDNLIEQFI